MRTAALCLAMLLMIPVALSTLAAQSIYVSIHVSRYGDTVLLNLSAALQRTVGKELSSWSSRTVLKLVTTYLSKERELVANLSLNASSMRSTATTPALTPSAVRGEVVTRSLGNASFNRFSVVGTVNVSRGARSGSLKLRILGYERFSEAHVLRLSVNGAIYVDQSLIPANQRREILSQLAMLSTLGPSLVNEMLRHYNITWLRFEKLRVSVSSNESVLTVSFRVLALINATRFLEWVSTHRGAMRVSMPIGVAPSTSSMPKLLSLWAQAIVLNVSHRSLYVAKFEIEPGATRLSVVGTVSMRGDVEKYFRTLSQLVLGFSTVPNASATGLSEVRKYLSEIVILPYNTSVYLSTEKSSGELSAILRVQNLRLGHAYLEGEKAVERLGKLLGSMIEGLRDACRSLGLKAKISVSSSGVPLSSDPRIANAFEKVFRDALTQTHRITAPSPGIETGTSETVVTVVRTVTVPPAPPSSLPPTTPLVTWGGGTTVSTVVKFFTTTLLRKVTVTSVLTTTKSVTVTKTLVRTTTFTSLSTVTKTVGNYGLYAALLVIGIAVGIGIGILVKRKPS